MYILKKLWALEKERPVSGVYSKAQGKQRTAW